VGLFFFWREVPKKNKIACSVGVGGWACLHERGRDGCRGAVQTLYERGLSGKETVRRGRKAYKRVFVSSSRVVYFALLGGVVEVEATEAGFEMAVLQI
jgi:hypothetical protein